MWVRESVTPAFYCLCGEYGGFGIAGGDMSRDFWGYSDRVWV